ncbi:MAG: heat-inducible transcriptional repressor HrcA [Pseudomonadota bacterium]
MYLDDINEVDVPKTPELSERALHLLKTLIDRYIHDGQPVGSRALSRDSKLNLSPATIRNVMSDLEDYGLLTSPHTSAGRVPTVSGYRLFVDSLLKVRPLGRQEIEKIEHGFEREEDSDSLLALASKMLSDVTRMAGVVTIPRQGSIAFRHIEFLPLSDSRVLVIFVTNEKEVHNRIIRTSKQFTSGELQQAANYLNAVFQGKTLSAVREAVVKDLWETRERMNREMIQAVEMARLAFQNEEKKDGLVLSGETNLMDFSELADMDRLRQLFEAFSQKREIIHLLDQCLEAEGVQIFIGEESGYRALDSCSLVTSSYRVNSEVVGVLGVIGPTRMEYERVIPFVDLTAKLLGAALNQKTSSPS